MHDLFQSNVLDYYGQWCLPCPQSRAGFYIASVSCAVKVFDCVLCLYDFLLSFFCQHFKVLYLWHDLTDIDQTWSQVSVDHSIYVI